MGPRGRRRRFSQPSKALLRGPAPRHHALRAARAANLRHHGRRRSAASASSCCARAAKGAIAVSVFAASCAARASADASWNFSVSFSAFRGFDMGFEGVHQCGIARPCARGSHRICGARPFVGNRHARIFGLFRRGEGGQLVTKSETVTAQGRFEHGFIHAQVISHPDGRNDFVGPPGPRPPPRANRWPCEARVAPRSRTPAERNPTPPTRMGRSSPGVASTQPKGESPWRRC
jgi:hypothetical protein